MTSLFCSILAFIAASLCTPARAEDAAGDFDFYVLSLSWSPTYCALDGSPEDAQCAVRRHGFILHGLWPQYERGYPEFCQSDYGARVRRETERAILDMMPSTGLIRHQWRKHGACSGLRQEKYFALAREAYQSITIPEDFVSPRRKRTLDPNSIERAFIAVNRGLPAQGIAVTCKSRHVADVRICLTRDLEFRTCPEVDADACRASHVDMLAVR